MLVYGAVKRELIWSRASFGAESTVGMVSYCLVPELRFVRAASTDFNGIMNAYKKEGVSLLFVLECANCMRTKGRVWRKSQ